MMEKQEYSFRVRAVNVAGESEPSEPSDPVLCKERLSKRPKLAEAGLGHTPDTVCPLLKFFLQCSFPTSVSKIIQVMSIADKSK